MQADEFRKLAPGAAPCPVAWLFECNQPGLKTNGLQTLELSSSFRAYRLTQTPTKYWISAEPHSDRPINRS